MKETLRKWKTSLKKRNDEKKREELRSRFHISERAGQLYIMCEGTAIASIGLADTAEDILDTLSAYRNSLLAYENLL